MTRLEVAGLHARAGFPALAEALGAADGLTRLVGGVVRDGLMGAMVEDVDLATRLHPDAVLATLAAHDIRAVATGLAHGTITAILAHVPYEITTLRQDVETFGRHATIAFTDSWQADAARRDFTINALYADVLTGEIHDYFGGLADLAARRVRFIGDPLQRIAEDHLRILRFFRFSARFAGAIDTDGLAACTARANDLMALSRERIRDELLKLLQLPAPLATITTMHAAGIFQPILPEIAADGIDSLGRLIAAEAKAGVAADALRRLAALLPADPDLAGRLAARLRLSNAQRARLQAGACRTPVPADASALAYRLGAAATIDRLLLTDDPRAAACARALADYVRPRLPVSGGDLIAMGLTPGPAVSQTLALVEQHWIDAGFNPDRAAALRLAREIVAARRSQG